MTCKPRLGVRLGELTVEGQAFEAFVAGLRQADKGIFAVASDLPDNAAKDRFTWLF
jgi:hypothetical protein